MPSQGFLCQCPVVPGALILHLGIKEVFFSHKSNPGYPGFHNLHRFRAPGPLQFSEHRHSDSGNTQIKARATPHNLNDWNKLRAHITRNYQWYGVALFLQLRWYIGIFQFIDYSVHGWSRPRLSLQASPYQAAKHSVRYQHDLFFSPCRIWQFPDAHFTEKSTKAVDINLKTIIIHDFMPQYSLFTLLISGILITKRVKVTPEGESREFKPNRWSSITDKKSLEKRRSLKAFKVSSWLYCFASKNTNFCNPLTVVFREKKG